MNLAQGTDTDAGRQSLRFRLEKLQQPRVGRCEPAAVLLSQQRSRLRARLEHVWNAPSVQTLVLRQRCAAPVGRLQRRAKEQTSNRNVRFSSIFKRLCTHVGGVSQWLGRRSLAGGLFLICARSMVDM